MPDSVEEYRALLLRHGIPVELAPLAGVEALLESAAGPTGAGWAIRHGRFTDGKRRLLILPPDEDIFTDVKKALALAADETDLQVAAFELVMALDKASAGCQRSPCGGRDELQEVSFADVEAARKLVGSPRSAKRPRPRDPLVVSYGLGVDSTALLVGLAALVRDGRREFRPSTILFADVGAEKDESYDYMELMNEWLLSVGFPEVTIVGWATEHTAKGYGAARTLEQQCLINQTMPSISASKFGASLCSVLWKQDVMNRWMELVSGLLEQRRGEGWFTKHGGQIVKAIGYDADETKRAQKGTFRVDQELRSLKDKGRDPIYEYWYPLQSWKWDRARCIAEIEAAIGKVPPKSSCTFCGAMRRPELLALPKDKLMRALLIETVAARGRHGAVQGFGLGGTFRWLDFAKENGLVTSADLARLERQVEVVLAAAPRAKGLTGEPGAEEGMRRLPAFAELLGFRGRGRKLPMWDRHEVLAEEAS